MWTVRLFEADHHAKRPLTIAPEPLDSQISDHSVRMPLEPLHFAIHVDSGVVIAALAWERRPLVLSGPGIRTAPHVELADVGRLVALLLEQGGKRTAHLVVGNVVPIAEHSVGVRIASGEEASARRAEERLRHKGVREADAFSRQPIDAWSLEEGMAGRTHHVPALVVRDDEEDVRADFLCSTRSRERGG